MIGLRSVAISKAGSPLILRSSSAHLPLQLDTRAIPEQYALRSFSAHSSVLLRSFSAASPLVLRSSSEGAAENGRTAGGKAA
jgi:hypothetical protein